jgi:hypothetical protein
MKDGDKAKNKAAKAKASGKETSSKTVAKAKGGQAVKASPKKESSSPGKASKEKAGSVKASPKILVKAGSKVAGKGSAKTAAGEKAGRSDDTDIRFTNPAIESAFRRAVKKYPNAFRRLTD